jgi:hypothetical protein
MGLSIRLLHDFFELAFQQDRILAVDFASVFFEPLAYLALPSCSSNDCTGRLRDHPLFVMDRELQNLPARPGAPVLHQPNLPAGGAARGWRLDRTEMLLTAGGTAFLCVIFGVLMQFIRPAPDKLTIQKDSAELARVEAQTQADHIHTEAMMSATASNADGNRISSKAKDHSESKAGQSRPVAHQSGLVGRKTELASSGANGELKTSEKYPRRQTERELQRQQASYFGRQRYAQQGPNSVLSAIARALGFSTQ